MALVWLFITTHGDWECGDLFYNANTTNYVDSVHYLFDPTVTIYFETDLDSSNWKPNGFKLIGIFPN
jgi:hypothetical protein